MCEYRQLLVCIAVLLGAEVLAQSADPPCGAAVIARALAVTADTLDVWNTAVNVATVADAAHPAASATAVIRSTVADPLEGACLVVIPSSACVFTGIVASSGVASFRETCVALGGALRFGSVQAGLRVALRNIAIARYGAASACTIDAGARASPAPGIALGVAIENLTRASVGVSHASLPSTVRIGIALSPHERVTITADAVGRDDAPSAMAVAVRAQLVECLAIAAGFTTEPSTFAAGIDVAFGGAAVGFAYVARPELGARHVLSARLAF